MKKIKILGLAFILLDIILVVIQTFIEMQFSLMASIVLASLFIIGVFMIEFPSLNFKENRKKSIIAILLELPLLVSITICIFFGIIGMYFWGMAYGISSFLLITLSYGVEFYPITIIFVIGFIASIIMIIRMRKK